MEPTTLALAAYLLAAMQKYVPESEHVFHEPNSVTHARYEAFAQDVAWAVLQPYVAPLFDGADGRAKTGLLLVTIASNESHYKQSVLSCREKGDAGTSHGPFQTTRDNRAACSTTIGAVRVALEMVRESFAVCRGLPLDEKLAEYTDGNAWRTERAAKRSRAKMGAAMGYWRKHPFEAPASAPNLGPTAFR